MHRLAADGVAGPAITLPFLDRIQRAFGTHDISGVQAHIGGAATVACEGIGAKAYATGNHVTFRDTPDLHTAAHEAAHVVQQRAGVQLRGGIGEVGDEYERNADQVADAVVTGKSAEVLLTVAGPRSEIAADQQSRPATSPGVSQRKCAACGATTAVADTCPSCSKAGKGAQPSMRPVQRVAVQRDLATPPPEVAPPGQPDLTPQQIQEAIRFNSQHYDAANTRLIQDILGGPVTGHWTADNIIAIAATQAEYGLHKDGKVGPDTFRFITTEQTLEGSPTDTANCLTSFRVTPHPVQQAATPGPGGTTQIQGHHVVEARFSSRCDCSQFQYRQFIAGVATGSRGAATQDLSNLFPHIPGGALPVAETEDGNTACPSPNYGHRRQPGQAATTAACGQDRYTNDDGTLNQPSGCVYRGEDFPVLTVNGLQTGDVVDVLIQFRGEIQRNGVPIETKRWTDINTTVTTP